MTIHREESAAFVKFGSRDIPPHPDISRRMLRRLAQVDDSDMPAPKTVRIACGAGIQYRATNYVAPGCAALLRQDIDRMTLLASCYLASPSDPHQKGKPPLATPGELSLADRQIALSVAFRRFIHRFLRQTGYASNIVGLSGAVPFGSRLR